MHPVDYICITFLKNPLEKIWFSFICIAHNKKLICSRRNLPLRQKEFSPSGINQELFSIIGEFNYDCLINKLQTVRNKGTNSSRSTFARIRYLNSSYYTINFILKCSSTGGFTLLEYTGCHQVLGQPKKKHIFSFVRILFFLLSPHRCHNFSPL